MLLRLFGAPSLLASDEPGAPVLLPPGKPVAVLAYLVRAPLRSAGRDELVDLLWSNAEPDRARQSLRQALTQLRRAVGAVALDTVGERVRLRAELASDVARFEAALAADTPREALRWATAPFLAAFATPGGAAFERWAAVERMRHAVAVARARELVAREHLRTGQFADARAAARRAMDEAPDREPAGRLLLEVLLAADDRLGALLEAEALERWLAAEGREPEPATSRMLTRARRLWSEAPTPPTVTTPGPLPFAAELVGREAEFAGLLAAWGRVRRGGLIRVHVVGPAGVGKSRLVADVRQRLLAAGAAAPFVRARPGARRVQGVVLADAVAALAQLPGALAIPGASAEVLVELAPTLADVFRGVGRAAPRVSSDLSPGEAAERRWLQAVEALVHAVTEERAVALVLDDVHWADEVSTRVLVGAIERVPRCRLLLITIARDGLGGTWDPPGDTGAAGRLPLAPLDASGIEALTRSIAALPDAPWPQTLLPALVSASGGLPLIALELLALLVERDLLALTADGWRLGAAERPLATACEALAACRGPGARVEALDPDASRVLATLAIGGMPLDVAAIAAACQGPEDQTEARLLTLAQRGLVRAAPDGAWEPAHDEIREAALAATAAETGVALGRALARHLVDASVRASDGGPALLMRAAAVLVAVGADDALPPVFARWRAARLLVGDHRRDRALARDLLGEAASPDRVRRLLAGRTPLERLTAASRRPIAAAAALVLATAAGAGHAVASRSVAGGGAAARRPARLALVTQPIAWPMGMPMTPVPIVEVQDAQGDPVVGAGDSVRVDALGSGAIVASGTSPVVRGRAALDRAILASPGDGPVSARFSYPGVPPLVVPINGARGWEYSVLRLRLVAADLNGQRLSPAQRVARVRAGDTIALAFDLVYTSPWPAANVVMGAAPSWGDPAKTFVRLTSLVTPARDFAVHTETRMPAPRTPGRYHIVVAFGAEENVRYLLSGTNWTLGRAIWNDGNDVAAWTAAQREEADRVGSAPSVMLQRGGGPISTGVADSADRQTVERLPIRVPATTLTVDIVPGLRPPR